MVHLDLINNKTGFSLTLSCEYKILYFEDLTIVYFVSLVLHHGIDVIIINTLNTQADLKLFNKKGRINSNSTHPMF